MESPYRSDNPFAVVFGPLAWGRTYGRLLYMLLCLPLGVAYFTFYVTGLSLGVGLAILLVGLVILLAVALATVPLGLFERFLTIHLLGEPVPWPGFRNPDGENFWTWLKDTLSNRVTWTSMLFLMIKFPLGLAAWIATIVALSVAFGVTASPVIVAFGGNVEFGFWNPATPAEALALVPVGLALIVLCAHFVNGLGWTFGKFARLMLGREPEIQSSPAAPVDTSAAPRLAPGANPAV